MAALLRSAAVAIARPTRQDAVAAVGELTAPRDALMRIRNTMLANAEGRRVLRLRPIVHTASLPALDRLRSLPAGSFGRAYVSFLDTEHVTPDSRAPIQHLDTTTPLDQELAYVLLRYRQCHDYLHVITGLPTSLLGEIALKWFEFFQTGLLMPLMAGIVGPVRLTSVWKFQDLLAHHEQVSASQLNMFVKDYWPWACQAGANAQLYLNTHFEQRFEQPLQDLRKELNLIPFRNTSK